MDMISPWMLYFWTRLDAIHTLFFNIAFFGVVFALGLALFAYSNCFGEWTWVYECNYEEKHEKGAQEIRDRISSYKNAAKKLIIIGFLSIFLMVAIPSKKDMAIIYVIPKIANNEVIQKESVEFYNIAKNALKEYARIEPNVKEVKE